MTPDTIPLPPSDRGTPALASPPQPPKDIDMDIGVGVGDGIPLPAPVARWDSAPILPVEAFSQRTSPNPNDVQSESGSERPDPSPAHRLPSPSRPPSPFSRMPSPVLVSSPGVVLASALEGVGVDVHAGTDLGDHDKAEAAGTGGNGISENEDEREHEPAGVDIPVPSPLLEMELDKLGSGPDDDVCGDFEAGQPTDSEQLSPSAGPRSVHVPPAPPTPPTRPADLMVPPDPPTPPTPPAHQPTLMVLIDLPTPPVLTPVSSGSTSFCFVDLDESPNDGEAPSRPQTPSRDVSAVPSVTVAESESSSQSEPSSPSWPSVPPSPSAPHSPPPFQPDPAYVPIPVPSFQPQPEPLVDIQAVDHIAASIVDSVIHKAVDSVVLQVPQNDAPVKLKALAALELLPTIPSNQTTAALVKQEKTDEPLNECHEELAELEQMWDNYRQAGAVFGGGVEEVVTRISQALRAHKCPAPVTTPASDAPALPLPSQELYKQVIHLTRANQSLTTRVARAENDSKLSAAATHKKELELADLHTKHQKVVERLHWEQAQVEEQLTSLARKLSQHCDDKDQEVQTLTAQLTAEKSAEETRRAAESDNNQVMGQLKSEITELRDMLEQSKNDVDETETRLLRAEENNHHLNLQLKEAISAARETAKEKQRLEFAVEVIQMRCVKAEDDLLLLSEEVSAVKAIEGNGFILVLVEAEARMFDPAHMSGGENGGYNAIAALRQATQRLYRLIHDREPEFPILIYLYFDIAKTIDELMSRRILKSVDEFDAFMEGLSSADDSLTISDVSGTWGASIKIRTQLSTLGGLNTCKMTLLVAGNDRRYLETIEKLGEAHREKIYAARSTGPLKASEDPFVSLGHDRLFHIDSLFPTRLHEWDAQKQSQEHRTGHIVGHPPLEPNPALVPTPVLRRPQVLQSSVSSPTDLEMGEKRPEPSSGHLQPPSGHLKRRSGVSLIQFTPMHTGEPQYQNFGYDRQGNQYGEGNDGYDSRAEKSEGGNSPPTRQSSNLPIREATPTPCQLRTDAASDPQRHSQAGAAPPWADIRGSQPQPTHKNPPSQQSSQTQTSTAVCAPAATTAASRPAQRPILLPRYFPTSIGGSPASSLENEPLLRHVAPASRTHVIRPPAFADGDSLGGTVSTDTLINVGTATMPIPGWTGCVGQEALRAALQPQPQPQPQHQSQHPSQHQSQHQSQSQSQHQSQNQSQHQAHRQPLQPQERAFLSKSSKQLTRGRLDDAEMDTNAKVSAWRRFE